MVRVTKMLVFAVAFVLCPIGLAHATDPSFVLQTSPVATAEVVTALMTPLSGYWSSSLSVWATFFVVGVGIAVLAKYTQKGSARK